MVFWISGVVLLLVGSEAMAKKKTVPLAKGEYRITLEEERIGQEKFSIFREKDKIIVESQTTLFWPVPTRHDCRFEIDSELQPKKIEMTISRSGDVAELELKHHRENWRLEIEREGQDKIRQDLGSRAGAEVDFGGLVYSGLLTRRIRLQPEAKRQVEVLVLDLSTAKGSRTKRSYERFDEEEVETEAEGKVRASLYEIEGDGPIRRLWIDPSDFVLRARSEIPEAGTLEYELVNLDAKWNIDGSVRGKQF
jgi:hypothetical protein